MQQFQLKSLTFNRPPFSHQSSSDLFNDNTGKYWLTPQEGVYAGSYQLMSFGGKM
jgi:hypothetical protein